MEWVALGLLLLVMYRNFWVLVSDTDIYYRGAFTRRLRHLPVATITRVGAVKMNGAAMATFISPEEKFTLSISSYNADPALQALERLNVPMTAILRPGQH